MGNSQTVRILENSSGHTLCAIIDGSNGLLRTLSRVSMTRRLKVEVIVQTLLDMNAVLSGGLLVGVETHSRVFP
jgi:hypothetical protein